MSEYVSMECPVCHARSLTVQVDHQYDDITEQRCDCELTRKQVRDIEWQASSNLWLQGYDCPRVGQ